VSRKNILIAAAIAAVLITGAIIAYFTMSGDEKSASGSGAETASSSSFPSAGGGAPGALPDPVIAVLDRNAILVATKVGQDITRQMQTYTNQARDRLAGERRALEAEVRALQDGNVPEAERAKRSAALQAREQRFMEASGREENILKASMAAAHGEVAKVMGPIVEQMTKERGVNMVLDRSAVMVSVSPDFDLTPDVIKALDAKMSSYPVTLITPKQ
jgi:Skp family chaperone for outer membrane proteins